MSGANVTASLTLKLNAIGEPKLAAIVAGLDKLAVAAAKDGSQLKGTQAEIAKLAARAPSLRTLESELVKLGHDAEQAKVKMAAKEIFYGPSGKPPIVNAIRSVEDELLRLKRVSEQADITKKAREMLGAPKQGFFTGHGFTSGSRQVLGVMRDMAVAGMGVKAVIQGAVGATEHLLEPSIEFQKHMVEIANKGGPAVRSQMDAIAKSARDVGKSTQFTANQAAEAGVELAAAGLDAAGIQTAMPTTLNFSQASGEGTSASAGLLVDVMSQFHKAPKDFANISDVLVSAANMSTISVHDLGESLKYVGPLASSAGISLGKTAGMLAFLGERGIKGSEGGTAMRKILSSLVHPTKQAKEAMTSLSISKKEMQDGLNDLPGFLAKISHKMEAKHFNAAKKLEIGKLLFGQEGMAAADILMQGATHLGTDGKTQLGAYTDAMENVDGATKAAAEAMDGTLGGSIARVKAKFENLQLEIGDKIAPGIMAGLNGIGPVINNVGDFVGRSSSVVEVGFRAAGLAGATALGVGLIGGWGSVGAIVTTLFGGIASLAATVFGTGFAATLVPVLTAALAGYKIGSILAEALGAEKFGVAINEMYKGNKDREAATAENDPQLKALKELEKQRAAKRAEAAGAGAEPVKGEIKVTVEDKRVGVRTVSQGPAKLRTGANAQ